MFTIEEILKSTGARLVRGSGKARVGAVSLDSRTLKAGELFIAIRGNRFDGHNFIEQARQKGTGAILLSDERYILKKQAAKGPDSAPIIRVKDTRRALGALARYHRMRFGIPVIAVTGSNGKTITKEMLKTIAGSRFNLLSSPGTENNLVGVSLAILRLRKSHQLLILELGANHPGEIDRLSWIAKPEVGIITNIGPSHLEFFRSLKGVFEAKIELIRNLAGKATLIINKDDRFLSQLNSRNLRKVTFGFSPCCDFYGEDIKPMQDKTSFLLNRRHRMLLRASGRHNVYNALAAISCARYLGITFKEIKAAFMSFQAPAMRMQMLDINGIKIINDCYNANPRSLECALDFLKGLACSGKRIVVCGDMLELGKSAAALHIKMGKKLSRSNIDFLITVGRLAKKLAGAAESAGMPGKLIQCLDNCPAAAESLKAHAHPGDIVLLKGSRAMKMENVSECFMSFFTR